MWRPNFGFEHLTRWFKSFAIELYFTNILFWLRKRSPPDKNILLSAAAALLIIYARRTHAAYWMISIRDVSATLSAVLAVCWGTSILGCLLDPKVRHSQNHFVSNVARCYRLIAVGTLISAAVICLNYRFRWSEKLGYWINAEDTFDEIIWAFALPAAAVAVLFILILSVLHKEFRTALIGIGDKVRLLIWVFFVFFAVTSTNLAIFNFGM